MVQRKRPGRATSKAPPTAAATPRPSKPAAPAGHTAAQLDSVTLDRDRRPILPGAIVFEEGMEAYGRVLHAEGGVLLYHTFPGCPSTNRIGGPVFYADGGECQVVEGPRAAVALPPAAAAALDVARRLAAIEREIMLAASSVTTDRDELSSAQECVHRAVGEMMNVVERHMADDDSDTTLTDALKNEGGRP